MHSDLLIAAKFRGYVDLTTNPANTSHYLALLIVAERNKPVRIEFMNQLAPRAEFKKQLLAYLGQLACKSPEIAYGLMRQIPYKDSVSSREGLEVVPKSVSMTKSAPACKV